VSASSNEPSAVLLLQDGSIFKGKAAGKIGTITGEICFNTGMTGYQEVFTDPSYYGQILIATNVHIGNYGIHQDETESADIKISGLVCKKFTTAYSRITAKQNIQQYFDHEQIVGICDVDTRALVKHIRHKGAMNAIISSEIEDVAVLKNQLDKVPGMAGLELSTKVTTDKTFVKGEGNGLKIAVMDYGCKYNILDCFVKRGAEVKVFPATTPFAETQTYEPDGYFISNGPGDPAAMDYAVEFVQQVLEADKPLFGICLGHQLLAMAVGIPTYKMHNGHRGLNHPVRNQITGKCEITSQNHGFGVEPEAIRQSDKVTITHVNLNDDTIEGIRIKDKPAFSVQYHPESSPGPHDSRYLFDDFLQLIKNKGK